MLVTSGTIKTACKAGANVCEMQEVGTHKVQYASGERVEPLYAPKYLAGESFGSHSEIPAPINLHAGDVLEVEAKDGIPLRVVRGGEVVWENKARLEQEAARAAAAARKHGIV